MQTVYINFFTIQLKKLTYIIFPAFLLLTNILKLLGKFVGEFSWESNLEHKKFNSHPLARE